MRVSILRRRNRFLNYGINSLTIVLFIDDDPIIHKRYVKLKRNLKNLSCFMTIRRKFILYDYEHKKKP